jgi:hypothetical protein
MKIKLLLIVMTIVSALNAQVIEGFENTQLDSGKVVDGRDGTTEHSFYSGIFRFPVTWDSTYKYWSSGWALSTVIYNRVEPSNYATHLYAAAPGFGVENGNGKAFMVGQNGSGMRITAGVVSGFYVANSTYAYNSMKFGDFAGKKFGGANGKDKDSFILQVQFLSKNKILETSRMALADFRFDDSTKDFISNKWQFVAAKPNPMVDSISFTLESSDNGQWGMNTPAFFVLDGLVVDKAELVFKVKPNPQVRVFPVPSHEKVQLVSDAKMLGLQVFKVSGQLVWSGSPESKNCLIQTQSWAQGIYYVQIRTVEGMGYTKLQVMH